MSAISSPSNLIEPLVGSSSRSSSRAGRRLAAAGLADEAERLAALDVERDAVDGVHGADLLAEDHARGEREVLDEVADLEQRLARRPASRPQRDSSVAAAPLSRRSCGPLSGHHVGARLLGPLALAQVVPDPPAHAGVEQAGDAVAVVPVDRLERRLDLLVRLAHVRAARVERAARRAG